MTITEKIIPYTVQFTPPMVTWTSFWLPVSRNVPKIVMRVPPALGPLTGFTASGIGFWWGRRSHKIQHEYILISPLQGFTNTCKFQHTCKHSVHSAMSYTHTHTIPLTPLDLAVYQNHSHTVIYTHSYKHHLCLNLLSKQLGGALPCGEALAEPEIWKAS